MKNWKEAPNLFANGKFKVRSELPSMPVGEVECILHGYANGQYRLQFSGIFDWVDVADRQLIARKIEDMTDEEWENNYFDNISEYKRYKHKHLDSIPFEAVIDFLSIGVYPFSDTEDVIFKPKQ